MEELHLEHRTGSRPKGAEPKGAEPEKRLRARSFIHTGVLSLVLLISVVVLGGCGVDDVETIAATPLTERTATPAPQPARTPTPEPDPTPYTQGIPIAGEVLYESDMTDLADDQDQQRFVEDGTYRMRVGLLDERGNRTYWVYTTVADENFADASFDVDLRLVTETAPNASGCLMLRAVFDDWVPAYFSFCMHGDGTTEASFQQSFPEEVEVLLQRESRDSGSDPRRWTRLSVIAQGDDFWFLINDQLVGTATYSGPNEGAIGVSVFNDAADLTEYEFTDLTVRVVE